jgi:hypothetical protein
MSPRALAATFVAAVLVAPAPACLRRPIVAEEPTTKIAVETVVSQPAVDKIDLLVMVGNSASMADKQRILADAVPDLVTGIVLPKCVDKRGPASRCSASSRAVRHTEKSQPRLPAVNIVGAHAPTTAPSFPVIWGSSGGGRAARKEHASLNLAIRRSADWVYPTLTPEVAFR